MLPMSNNGTNNATSNGRNSANSTTTATAKTSISHKQNDGKTMMTTTTSKSMPPPLPEKNSSSIQKSNNNDSNNSSNTNEATHRRDSSSLSGQQQQQSKRDSRKYQYAKPQTRLQPQINDKSIEEQLQIAADAAENDSQLLVYYENNLVSGTLDALIEHMVPTSEYYPERNYIFSFLLSARLFIRPHELLAQISHTWERQQQKYTTDVVDEANFSHSTVSAASASPLVQRKVVIVGGITATTAIVNDIGASAAAADNAVLLHGKSQRTATQKCAQNCIRLLSEWIETFPYDFRDERLMQQVRILARKCVYIDNSLGKQVSRILQLLVQRLTALEKYEEFLQSLIAADLNSSQHSSLNTSASASYTASSSSSSSSSNATTSAVGLNNCLGKSNHHHTESHYKSTLPASSAAHASSASNSNAHASAAASDNSNSHDMLHGIMDICPSCAHLAHQLTAIELDRLSHIGPEEFVQAFAKEYQHSIASKGTAGSASASASTSGGVMSTSLNDMKKTRNLESYVEWFNRLSYLTASEIVKYPKKKQRVRIIEYWIETARECFNIGNFNSLMAIIAGLNLSPISRLKKTWSKVQSAKFSVLEHQMDPTSNFNSYRSTLKAAMWRSEGATDERERIIIPFFSLFVKDLYFLNEGCSNRLPNNHINFEKCSQLAKQVMEFNEWKKVTCPFEKLPNVIAFLQNSTVLNENTLSMASFECEPPENTEEKGRYKTVKAETKQQLLQQLQ